MSQAGLGRAVLLAASMAEPGDPADEKIARAEAAAAAAAAMEAGQAFAATVGRAFGREQRSAVSRCVSSRGAADFELFLRLGADGRVQEALARPADGAGPCVASRLSVWRAPRPAAAGTWVTLAVRPRVKSR